MLFVTIIKVSLKSLYANKLRSILAMLGIIIGVAAVISMLSIGAGAQKDIMDRISSMGTNLLSIRSGQRGQHGVMTGSFNNLTLQDAEAVLGVKGVVSVSPVVQGSAQVKYFNSNSRTGVMGVAVTYQVIRNYDVEFGRFFKSGESDRMARVAVIGAETATNLNFTKDNLGEQIKIKGINFQVTGILKSKGGGGMFNQDDVIMIPYTTAMGILLGKDNLDSIDVMGEAGTDMVRLEEDLTALMRKRHKILQSKEDDFRVFNQADIIETASDFSKTFTFLLGGIAAISLLVGGIGIMNIMLVTVTERTREIGVRKAIGARDKDILKQFLIESLIMSCVGGLIGVVVGIAASVIIGNWSDFKTFIQPGSVVLSLFFSVGVGVFFGYYPAYRAAQLDPIQCLYYE